MNKRKYPLLIIILLLSFAQFAEAKCYVKKKECTDSGCKIINGVSVCRDCWNWSQDYVCDGGGSMIEPSETGTGVPDDCESPMLARSKKIIGNDYQDCINELVCDKYQDVEKTARRNYYCSESARVYGDRTCNVWEILPVPPPPPPTPPGCTEKFTEPVNTDIVGPHGLLVEGEYFLNPDSGLSPETVFDNPSIVTSESSGADGRTYVEYYSNKIFTKLGLDDVVWVSDGERGKPSSNLEQTGSYTTVIEWPAYEKVNGAWRIKENPTTTKGSCRSCHIQYKVPPELFTCEKWDTTADWVPPPPVYNEGECSVWMENKNCIMERNDCQENDQWGRCAHYERSYLCADVQDMSGCEYYDNNSACSLISSSCSQSLNSGDCQVYDKTYLCNDIVTERECQTYVNRTICGGDLFCLDPDECADTSTEPDRNFGLAVTNMSVLDQIRKEFDVDSLTTFSSDKKTCEYIFLDLLNCCDHKKMASTILASMSGAYTAGKLVGTLDTFMNLYSFSGGGMLGLQNALSGTQFLTFDPYSLAFTLAMIGVQSLLTCSPDSLSLSLLVEGGMCEYIGDRCSSSVMGICLERQKVYCCFQTKLAQIIQVQGRKQIGRGWGSADSPDCGGLSLEEIQQIDFTKIDFSDYISRTVGDLPEPENLQIEIQDAIDQFYDGA